MKITLNYGQDKCISGDLPFTCLVQLPNLNQASLPFYIEFIKEISAAEIFLQLHHPTACHAKIDIPKTQFISINPKT